MASNPSADAPRIIAGVDRAHGRSTAQKSLFLLIHALSLLICAYIAFGGHLTLPGKWSGWQVVDPVRAALVLAVTALYAVRLGFTLLNLLQRRFGWSEALGLGFTILPLEVGFCLLAAGLTRGVPLPLGGPDYLAVALVLIGSYLNSWSELQRKWWKERPENRGRCYTEGLFALSRHINYFGDCVLFTGWSLLTGVVWALAIPTLMSLTFVVYHIPGLELYLEERYGDEFRAYRKRTKRFIPFLY